MMRVEPGRDSLSLSSLPSTHVLQYDLLHCPGCSLLSVVALQQLEPCSHERHCHACSLRFLLLKS